MGLVRFDGFDGGDRFENQTSVPSTVFAGAGQDILIGGSSRDQLVGDAGTDTADGRGGTDRCVAETEFSCELN